MIIVGDLLEFECDMIVQQCNCLTVKPHGLSKIISDKWEEADIYSKRNKIGHRNLATEEDRGVPGTCLIIKLEKESNCKYVASIFGQWKPGKVDSIYNYPKSQLLETSEQRERWFERGLEDLEIKLKGLNEIKRVAFPYCIGCGLAGGNWKKYLKMIRDFDERNEFKVYVIKKE